MTDLEKSEIVIAKILEKLLEAALKDHWILGFDDLGLSDDYEVFFGGCGKWLVAENVIRVSEIAEVMSGPPSLISPSLTAKGFAILGQSFSFAGKEISASEIVKDKASGQANYTGFGDFLGGVIGGFAKSINS